MPKRKTTTQTRAAGNLPIAAPPPYPIAQRTIAPTQLFRVPERHPRSDGPWKGEADKIGWTDEATGLRCIILRQRDGALSGYVGVGISHPYFGFDKDAVPSDPAILVHGGLTYAKMCEHNLADERVSVCHARRQVRRGTQDVFADDEEVWWFGFDTDLPCDYAPKSHALASGAGRVYRDQGYVYREIVRLAAQLSQVETGSTISLADDVSRQVPPVAGRD